MPQLARTPRFEAGRHLPRQYLAVTLALGLVSILALLWRAGGPSTPVVAAPSNPSAALAQASVYTNPTTFEAAVSSLVTPTIIEFDDMDASPVNNTYLGRDEFDGASYASQGVTFTNPMAYPLYLAPGGLFWNASNSLSVGRFPWDPAAPLFFLDDDLYVSFDPPCVAACLTLVDASVGKGSYVQFLAADQSLVASVDFPPDFASYRAFAGIVSTGTPIVAINVVEAANDGDDVNYDDVTCHPWLYRVFLPLAANAAPPAGPEVPCEQPD